jgi:hypothetical protein
MTAAEVFEALKAAPKLVAGPWEFDEDERLERLDTEGDSIAWQHDSGHVTIGVEPDDVEHYGEFATRDEADARLRELGWLLVDDATEVA